MLLLIAFDCDSQVVAVLAVDLAGREAGTIEEDLGAGDTRTGCPGSYRCRVTGTLNSVRKGVRRSGRHGAPPYRR